MRHSRFAAITGTSTSGASAADDGIAAHVQGYLSRQLDTLGANTQTTVMVHGTTSAPLAAP